MFSLKKQIPNSLKCCDLARSQVSLNLEPIFMTLLIAYVTYLPPSVLPTAPLIGLGIHHIRPSHVLQESE